MEQAIVVLLLLPSSCRPGASALGKEHYCDDAADNEGSCSSIEFDGEEAAVYTYTATAASAKTAIVARGAQSITDEAFLWGFVGSGPVGSQWEGGPTMGHLTGAGTSTVHSSEQLARHRPAIGMSALDGDGVHGSTAIYPVPRCATLTVHQSRIMHAPDHLKLIINVITSSLRIFHTVGYNSQRSEL